MDPSTPHQYIFIKSRDHSLSNVSCSTYLPYTYLSQLNVSKGVSGVDGPGGVECKVCSAVQFSIGID